MPTTIRLCLLIPAYRPPAGFAQLMDAMLDAAGDRFAGVFVVDDGSGPDFAPVFEALERDPRVTVVRHAVNLGKGAALKTGFNACLVAFPDAIGVVTADADGQHSPADTMRVAEALAANPTELVVGARAFEGKVPWRNLLGNRITQAVFRVLAGVSLSDTQTGLRGWPRKLCQMSMRIGVNGYDFELEALMRGRREGLIRQPVQIPIRTIYTDGNRSSHFNPLLDSMRIYYVFLRYCASSMAAASVDYVLFLWTLAVTGSIAHGMIVARSGSIVVSFLLARKAVFQSHANWAGSLVRFVGLVAVMGVVSYNLIQAMHTYAGVPVTLAKMIAEGSLYLGNFAIQREFIFTNRTEE
ncbi:MAG: bifunctional glycosyltransferase family 2/GtrA family protein [Bryobacteraceae bacterium]